MKPESILSFMMKAALLLLQKRLSDLSGQILQSIWHSWYIKDRFFAHLKHNIFNRQSTGGCTHRPELGRKVVPMYVYNSFWSFSVCYYVMCSNYTGDYLQEAQIKTTTWPGKNSDRFYRLIFARSEGCVLPVGCLLRVLYHIIHKSQKRVSFKPRLPSAFGICSDGS